MLNCKDNYGKLWAEKYISGKMSGGIGKRIGWNLICGINPVLCYGCIASYQSVPYRFKSCLIYKDSKPLKPF
jgi:hypothetical protein